MTLAVEQTRLLGSEIVGSLNAVDYKWPQNQQLDENKFIPVETFTKAKRAQSTTDDETWVEGKPAPTLNAFDQGDTRATTEDISQTLSAKMGTGGNNTPMVAQAIPIQDGRDIEKHQNGLGIGDEGAPSYTLDQTGAQAVAYSIRKDAKANTFSATELDRSNALSALRPSPQSHHAQMFITEIQQPVAFTTEQTPKYNVDQALTITKQSPSGGGQPQAVMESTMAVRRLTPIECERLMGWPDNWTEGQADTHRYKQCGNGVASPVATWIAQHLQQLDKDTNATPTQTPTT